MPFSDRKDEVIELRQSGLTPTQIAERCGVCAQLVSRYLIDWGYRTRKRDDTDWAKATIRRPVNPKAVKRFEPGKQYGDYTFLEMVAARRPLWLFEHRCGWKETFTELQLREARMA
jgi:predicted transcriptional regulator